MNANDIVSKLWRLCSILRKDGITYQQYVTELTYLLFLKMLSELGREEEATPVGTVFNIPRGLRWRDLVTAKGAGQLELYQTILNSLGNSKSLIDAEGNLVLSKGLDSDVGVSQVPTTVQAIFSSASTFLRHAGSLKQIVEQIDKMHWHSPDRDQFGDLYEGLLQKNAEETKRGAGQYFTPRALVEIIVELMQPSAGEVIQDPAAGTGGFLIWADKWISASSVEGGERRKGDYFGMENVAGTYRLLLMNMYLRGIDPLHVQLGDTLSPAGAGMPSADLILTNPPFGPAGGRPNRPDLTITNGVSSYQLPFVEHCVRGLTTGGRAAIIVPDNVLFESGRGKQLRRMIMEHCRLHTILRLPPGIFYAQGVKTNVLFLERVSDDLEKSVVTDATKEVWVYDLRTDMPSFGKTNTLGREHLAGFVAAYSAARDGQEEDVKSDPRFRRYSRREISEFNDSLDLGGDAQGSEVGELTDLTEVSAAADRLAEHLELASNELGYFRDLLRATRGSS